MTLTDQDPHSPILVTGGTGGIGRPLVEMLVAAKQKVRVLSRNPARARTQLGREVEIAEGDLQQPASLERALAGCQRAFFLGQADQGLAALAASFAAAARASGTRHIVAISSGTIEITPRVTIGAWHAALEEELRKSGAATTFLRPGNFATNTLRWAEAIQKLGKMFTAHADNKSSPIDPYDIAAVAAFALLQPGQGSKSYTISGPEIMSPREQVAIIAREIGRPIEVVDLPPATARSQMIAHGVPDFMADAILELMDKPPRTTPVVQQLLGREPRSFATWVHENRAAFMVGSGA